MNQGICTDILKDYKTFKTIKNVGQCLRYVVISVNTNAINT